MTCLENAQKLQQMIAEGKAMEAVEQLYHDDVVVVEGDGSVRNGKAAQIEAVKQWQGMVQEMHGGGLGALTANEEAGTSCAETWVDLTMKNGNRMKLEEVAVQKWKDGKIIHERFYYNVPPKPQHEG